MDSFAATMPWFPPFFHHFLNLYCVSSFPSFSLSVRHYVLVALSHEVKCLKKEKLTFKSWILCCDSPAKTSRHTEIVIRNIQKSDCWFQLKLLVFPSAFRFEADVTVCDILEVIFMLKPLSFIIESVYSNMLHHLLLQIQVRPGIFILEIIK